MISLITLLTILITIQVHALDLDQTFPSAWPVSDDGPAAPPLGLTQPGPILVVDKVRGPYKTIKQAVEAANKMVQGVRVVIRVKSGEYNEVVVVTRPDVTLIGDGAGKTVITGFLSTAGGITTYKTAIFSVERFATGFMGRGLTFRNTFVGVGDDTGGGHPAVAFQSSADKTVLYECNVEGFQDTIDVAKGRHFYKNCNISGAIDFIFGYGGAVFQNCNLLLRNISTIFITAQGKESMENKTSGFVFHDCEVRASPELEPGPKKTVLAYLGRPWRPYSTVVFIKTYLDGHVSPAGWSSWNATTTLPDTVFFAEYRNYGPGSNVSARAKSPGIRVLTSYDEASRFSVRQFLLADGDWLSSFRVPFNSTI